MRAFLSIKYHTDQANRPRIEHVLAAMERSGLETRCVVRDIEQWGSINIHPAELMRLTFDEIDRCNLLVAELSEKGVGIGIEAGYAAGHGIPVVTVVEEGAKVSSTLGGISRTVIHYTSEDDLTLQIQKFLAEL
jgi:nucleoside 2-deoxyribosyltransferase